MKFTISVLLMASALVNPATVRGHVGDRVVPIPEITDDMLSAIDLHDGSVEEWEELFSTPILTPADFAFFEDLPASDKESQSTRYYEPADMDFRMWLGWRDATNQIYLAALFSDSFYRNEYEPGDFLSLFFEVDLLRLWVDGDHSGGITYVVEEGAETVVTAHFYYIVARSPDGTSLISALSASDGWEARLPYADGGGEVFGEAPAVSVIECFVTPFDALAEKDQQVSVASDLAAGNVVGLNIDVWDVDADVTGFYQLTPGLDDVNTIEWLADGLLLGAGDGVDDTVVEASSWGRIKASLR